MASAPAKTRPRVIIESPFSGYGDKQKERDHAVYLRLILLDSIKRGEAPFASHAIYPQVMDDDDPPLRHLGIHMGFRWGELAHYVAVYVDRGISPGMQAAIEHYRTMGLPIEFRQVFDDAQTQGGVV